MNSHFKIKLHQYEPPFLFQATLVYGENTVLGAALFYSGNKHSAPNYLDLKNLGSWASKLIFDRFGVNCHPAIEMIG